jgi:hypothetical protein
MSNSKENNQRKYMMAKEMEKMAHLCLGKIDRMAHLCWSGGVCELEL